MKNFRLIALNESYSQWLPMNVVEKMIVSPKHNFMDITDHPDAVVNQMPFSPIPTQLHYVKYAAQLITNIDVENLRSTVTMLSTFFTRYYTSTTGQLAADAIFKKFESYRGARPDVSVRKFKHNWLQESIIARIEGTNSNLAGTVIVIGAHEDSVGRTTASVAPGADDDASGTACVLEIFRVIVESGIKFERTLEFHTYAGEEAGLKGSQDIAYQYYQDNVIVEAMMQFDMTMYEKVAGEPIGVITDFTNIYLNQLTYLLINAYTSISYVNSKCGYGCSDHASWTKYGYRSTFTFETSFANRNPYIHTELDTINRLNVARGVQFVRLGLGFLLEMGLVASNQ